MFEPGPGFEALAARPPIRVVAAFLLIVPVSLSSASAAEGVRIEDAIRSAWRENPGLAAGNHLVAAPGPTRRPLATATGPRSP